MAKASGMLAASVGAAAKMMGSRNRNNKVSNQRPPKPQAAPQYTNSAGQTIQQDGGQMPASVAARAAELNIKPTFVPGLMEPGMKGYDPTTGGGNWVFAQGKVDPEQLRAWYRGDPNNGTDLALEGKNRQDFTLSGLYGSSSATTPSSALATSKSYKDIKSITGGLKIGGDNILGRREASRISRNTGKTYDDVITKALGRGMSIGGGAVRQSNRAYEKSGQALMDRVMGGLAGESPLSEMRRVTPGKRQMFSGTYQLDGKTMPLIESRRGGTNPMTIGGGKGKRGGKGRNRVGGMTDVGTGTGTGMGTQPAMDLQPMTPEQMQEASTVEGVGMLSGGGMGATGASRLGRARSRLRQLGIYGRGTSLLGRGLQYGNVLNA